MNELIIIGGIPILRGVAGWLQNALEDGKISLLEWRKLAKTVLRLGVPALALFYGLDVSAELSAAIPLVADYFFDAVKKVDK